MTRPGIEPQPPGPFASTLLIRPIARFNKIIVPYIPNKYSIKSTYEFLQILNSNVTVYKTIKIIIENIDNHHSIPPPVIQPKILEKFLFTCTTKVLFYDPSDKIYIQIDGILMGSPLGPTISKFYKSHIENKIFETLITKPKIYVHYVDDIFIATHSYDKITKL